MAVTIGTREMILEGAFETIEFRGELQVEDEVVGAVNVFRHNTDKTVPGIL